MSLRQQVPGDLADAAIVYRLMTPVPDNWVPFVAVPAPDGGVELERRPLLHFRDDGTTDVTHPARRAPQRGRSPPAPRGGRSAARRRRRHPPLPAGPHAGRRHGAVDRPPQAGRRRRRLERVALRHRPATGLGLRGSTRFPPVAMHATARAPECACDREHFVRESIGSTSAERRLHVPVAAVECRRELSAWRSSLRTRPCRSVRLRTRPSASFWRVVRCRWAFPLARRNELDRRRPSADCVCLREHAWRSERSPRPSPSRRWDETGAWDRRSGPEDRSSRFRPSVAREPVSVPSPGLFTEPVCEVEAS